MKKTTKNLMTLLGLPLMALTLTARLEAATAPKYAPSQIASLPLFSAPVPTGTGILVVDNEPHSGGTIASVAMQSDGKMVVKGHGWEGEDVMRLELLRFNQDGSLDTAFNGNGRATTDLGYEGARILVQSDGKLLAVGSVNVDSHVSENGFVFVRYQGDGIPDTYFNGTGRASVSFPADSIVKIWDIALQSDGKILLAGTYQNDIDSDSDFVLLRLNANGVLDSSFNGTGVAVLDLKGHSTDDIGALAVQSDGMIIAAGSFAASATDFSSLAVVRFNAQGALDTSFGTNGRAVVGFSAGGSGYVNGMAVQSDGKILISSEAGLTRLTSIGALDTTFNGTGQMMDLAPAGLSSVVDMTLQPDGRIVVGGDDVDGNLDFAIARFNSNGALDSTLGGTGHVTTDIGSHTDDSLNDLAIQSDGKIVAVGSAAAEGTMGMDSEPMASFMTIVRYAGDGSLDASFGGKLVTVTAAKTSGSGDTTSAANTTPDSAPATGGCSLVR